MKRITGTHVYQLLKCERAVALDLGGDKSLRRPARPEEELLLQRGRAHEADFVAGLGWPEPAYPAREFEAGARATEQLLRAGVPGVLQGVLLAPDGRLGIADLLRREPGESAFGDFHYVVGDVKSSARVRGDQILQVAFYADLLGDLQGRAPGYGYLVMKDGREERFDLADFRPALQDVVERVRGLRERPELARPFFARACDACRWSPVCEAELHERDDLSLVHGMTAGLRTMLEAAGVATAASLADVEVAPLARRTRIESAMLRRLTRAAQARRERRPLPERIAKATKDDPPAFVHVLRDAHQERALYLGVLVPGPSGDAVHAVCPGGAHEEWASFRRLLEHVPPGRRLWHFGRAVPDWFERRADMRSGTWLEERFVDLQRRVRSVASWPAPVFGMADLVRQALRRDPHREGRSEAAAVWAHEPGGEQRLLVKGRCDLEDLRDLHAFWSASRSGAPLEVEA